MKKQTILIKEKGKMIANTDEVNSEVFKQEHLCISCKHVSPCECQKVADVFTNNPNEFIGTPYRPKQPISEYPEIKSGWQKVDRDNNVNEFVVTECDNYEFVDKNANPKITLKELNEIRANLLDFYKDLERAEEQPIGRSRKKTKGKCSPNVDSLYQR